MSKARAGKLDVSSATPRQPGARRRFIEPCHPSERDEPPLGVDWVHEIKMDGYRAQVHLADGRAIVYSRRGHDWSEEFSAIARAAESLPVRDAVLDGEGIVQDRMGIADFNALRREIGRKRAGQISYYAFDLLFLNGEDLRAQPLVERKRRLQHLLEGAAPTLLFAEYVEDDAEVVFREACRMGLEGIVSKRRNSPYRSGRQSFWIKSKCRKSGTFAIVGFVEKLGAKPRRLASFYVGRRQGDRLGYAGKVQSGFTLAEARQLRERLDGLIIARSPLSTPIEKPKATWVKPLIEAELEFNSLTEDGLLRAAVFKGVRDDLAEEPPSNSQRHRRLPVPDHNILQLLPEAVVPSRQDLTAYWRQVAAKALPYLRRRPLKLVRHTRGITFYHKGPLPAVPPAVHQLRIEKREGGQGVRLWVDDLEGLLGLVQIGVVELHPWAATVDDIEQADTLVFDLDPGEGVAWELVIAAGLRLRHLLGREGLDCWPKLTGGKGLHVMVPLAEKLAHDLAHRYAKTLVQRLAAESPERYLTVADLAKRRGKIFLDYLRNGRGTTAIGTYSPRVRAGFPIAAPLSWTQLKGGVRPDAFTMARPFRRPRGPL